MVCPGDAVYSIMKISNIPLLKQNILNVKCIKLISNIESKFDNQRKEISFVYIFYSRLLGLASKLTFFQQSLSYLTHTFTQIYVVVQFYPWFKFYFLLF